MKETQNTPELRFEGFTETWKQHKLRELARIRTGFPFNSKDFSDNGHYRVITNANIQDNVSDVNASLGNRIDIEDEQLLRDYGLDIGDILVTMDGTVGRTAKVADDQLILAQRVGRLSAHKDGEFLYQALNSGKFSNDMATLSHGGTIKHISLEEIGSFLSLLPDSSKEQHLVGCFFSNLDSLIAFQQRKYERLQHLKQALLQKMFPKPGEQVPELRFEGFTEPWEQRKIKDVATIERGGSPRPIKDFVTDSPDGLNWVKIGDAPSLGRYITRTAEKIRPEGLSKTRQVYPGDLILSNSMSFGRPYIMAIEGCIHDGWLLIRDTTKQLDPIYLCQMLDTPQMFKQYRSLAAGSTVNNLNKELVGNAVVSIPCKAEQEVIGKVLDNLDNLVILYQRKCERLRRLKQALLQKMFI